MIPATRPLLAIFVEPEGSLRSALLARKALLEARMPAQAYTAHPPHCTLLFGDFGLPEPAVSALRVALADLTPFVLRSTSWRQFPGDTLAGGGHTIAFGLELTEELQRLQRRVAEAIGPWRDRKTAAAHPLARREPFASSLEHYGYPFVGAHWLPHCTIGSPRVAATDPLIAELMSGSPEHTFEVRSVSLWLVHGDQHTRYASVPLNGSRP